MGCEQEFGYKVWTVVDSELIHTKEVGCRGEIFVLCLISVWKICIFMNNYDFARYLKTGTYLEI